MAEEPNYEEIVDPEYMNVPGGQHPIYPTQLKKLIQAIKAGKAKLIELEQRIQALENP